MLVYLIWHFGLFYKWANKRRGSTRMRDLSFDRTFKMAYLRSCHYRIDVIDWVIWFCEVTFFSDRRIYIRVIQMNGIPIKCLLNGAVGTTRMRVLSRKQNCKSDTMTASKDYPEKWFSMWLRVSDVISWSDWYLTKWWINLL